MNQRNCPNCAAPYDVQLSKCPYCGTSYFDLSNINLVNREPFYLKIKVNMGSKDYYITQLVRPGADMEIITECDNTYAQSGNGKLISFRMAPTIKTNLSFEAIKGIKFEEATE